MKVLRLLDASELVCCSRATLSAVIKSYLQVVSSVKKGEDMYIEISNQKQPFQYGQGDLASHEDRTRQRGIGR